MRPPAFTAALVYPQRGRRKHACLSFCAIHYRPSGVEIESRWHVCLVLTLVFVPALYVAWFHVEPARVPTPAFASALSTVEVANEA